MANNIKLVPNVWMVITPTLVSQSIPNNTSTVRVTVTLENPYGTFRYSGYGSGYRIRYIIKNGSNTLYDTGMIDFEYHLGRFIPIDRIFTLTHNSNGTIPSNQFSVTLLGGSGQGLTTTSGMIADTSLNIPTIPRYATVNSFVRSAYTRNSLNLSFTTDSIIDYFDYKVGNGAWTGATSGDRTSGSISLTGLSPNSSYPVTLRVKRKESQLYSEKQTTFQTDTTATVSTPSSPSKTAISISVAWTSNKSVINVQYTLDNGASWKDTNLSDFSPRTQAMFVINNLTPNTEYKIKVRVKDEVAKTWSTPSGELLVSTYWLPGSHGISNKLDTSKNVVMQDAQQGTIFARDVVLQIKNDSGNWIDIRTWLNVTERAFQYNLTENEVETIQNHRVNSNSVEFRYKATVKWGVNGVVQGVTYGVTRIFTIINANPIIENITYEDSHSDSEFINWKGGNQYLLRNHSPIKVTVGNAQALKGAKLSKYLLTILDKNATTLANNEPTQNGAVLNLGTIDSAVNVIGQVTVQDSRGNTSSKTFEIQMKDWYAPLIVRADGVRANSYEQATTLDLTGKFTEVKNGETQVNEFIAEWQWKKANDEQATWSMAVPILVTDGNLDGIIREVKSNQFMRNFDENSNFEIKVRYKDRVSNFKEIIFTVEMGIGLVEWFKDRVEFGVPLKDKESQQSYLHGGLSDHSIGYTPKVLSTSTTGNSFIQFVNSQNTQMGLVGFNALSNSEFMIYNRRGSNIAFSVRGGGSLLFTNNNGNIKTSVSSAYIYIETDRPYFRFNKDVYCGTQKLLHKGQREGGAITLMNGWSDYSSDWAPPWATKLPDGQIILKGMIKGGTLTGGSAIGRLPTGYAPSKNLTFPVATDGGIGKITIWSDGTISHEGTGISNAWLSLSGITYEVL